MKKYKIDMLGNLLQLIESFINEGYEVKSKRILKTYDDGGNRVNYLLFIYDPEETEIDDETERRII